MLKSLSGSTEIIYYLFDHVDKSNNIYKGLRRCKKEVKDDEKPVNITIKVPRKSRQYWTSQCKLAGLTMTEVLVEALIERFGEPK